MFERITNPSLYNKKELLNYGYTKHLKKEQINKFPDKIYLDNICYDEDKKEINKNDCNGFNYNIHYPSQYESLSYFTNDFKNCKKNEDCIHASKKQMDAYSIFPRHSIHNNIKDDVTKPTKCGISSKMEHLVKRKMKYI